MHARSPRQETHNVSISLFRVGHIPLLAPPLLCVSAYLEAVVCLVHQTNAPHQVGEAQRRHRHLRTVTRARRDQVTHARERHTPSLASSRSDLPRSIDRVTMGGGWPLGAGWRSTTPTNGCPCTWVGWREGKSEPKHARGIQVIPRMLRVFPVFCFLLTCTCTFDGNERERRGRDRIAGPVQAIARPSYSLRTLAPARATGHSLRVYAGTLRFGRVESVGWRHSQRRSGSGDGAACRRVACHCRCRFAHKMLTRPLRHPPESQRAYRCRRRC